SEEPLRHRLIDDDDPSSGCRVLGAEIAAAHERDFHRGEVIRCDRKVICLLSALTVRRSGIRRWSGFSLDEERHRNAVRIERGPADRRCRNYSGNGADAFDDSVKCQRGQWAHVPQSDTTVSAVWLDRIGLGKTEIEGE